MTFTPIAANHHHPRRVRDHDGYWCRACGVAWPCDAYTSPVVLQRDKREVAALLDFIDDELEDPFPEPDLGRDDA